MARAEDPHPRRSLPSVDRVLHAEPVAELLRTYAREPVVRLVRQALVAARESAIEGGSAPSLEQIAETVSRDMRRLEAAPVSVINATGVILHTNLGRATLSAEARMAVSAAAGYCDLELDLQTGERGGRLTRVGPMLTALTGAAATHVTVNNAAAITLALAALARGKEVLVSRGQAVEIGGGFRIPAILRQSGARLVDVGTTNRTRLADYEEALSPRTGAILHVHTSNFRVTGFAEQVELTDLASLARKSALPLIDDNGSGAFLDTAQFGLAHEPTPAESLAAGADLVAFSGDKLLGGPQAGLLLGRRDLMDRIARSPLARAVRPDKLALAALSATLLSYLTGTATLQLPVWRMISQSREEIERRAERWTAAAAARGMAVTLEPGESTVGGGSLPGETLPTTLIRLPSEVRAGPLRLGMPPVIGRSLGRRVLLDLRTVEPDDEERLLEAVVAASKIGVIHSATR